MVQTASIHNTQDTSKEAYKHVRQTGVEMEQHEQILDYLRRVGKPVTRRQISHATGIENSTVSARVNPLIHKLKVLHEPFKDKCPITGITVSYVALVQQGHQQALNF